MTPSRPPAAPPPRPRAAPRAAPAPRRTVRPAFAYALAATLAAVAADAVTRAGDAPEARPTAARAAPPDAALPARDAPRAAPPAAVPEYVSEDVSGARPTPAPQAPTPAPPQQEAGIPPDAWKPPPPTDPDLTSRPHVDEVWPGKGPDEGGARVEIRGKNLDPAFVLFGRSPAKILSQRDSGGGVVLTVLAPPRTGPAQEWIVVTNRDGSSAVAAERFEYYR